MSRRSASTDQLDLFAPPPPCLGPDLASLAARLPRHVRFGTSSWTYSGWKGLVYRERYANEADLRRRSLAEYARCPLFRTVGLDRTYYAPMSSEQLALAAAQVPDDFVFVVKALADVVSPIFPRHPRYGERAGRPNPRFLDPGLFRELVGEPLVRGLGRHLGPVVLSIPPTRGPGWDASRLERALASFLRAAPPGIRYAVELRDRRLFTKGYFRVLADGGATHVFNYWSDVPSIAEQLARDGSLLGPHVVARLMLPPGGAYDALKASYAPFDRLVRPDPILREHVTELIEVAGDRGYEVFVIVNNKAEGSAPLTCEALARKLVDAPP